MKRGVITSLVFLFSLSFAAPTSFAQGCVNADFTNYSFAGWEGAIGNCCPIQMDFYDTLITGRHTLMTIANGIDTNVTCTSLPVVPPGHLVSARLGDANVDSMADRLSYTYLVTPASALFTFKFAVVLQEPGHTDHDEPRFLARILDSNGQLLSPNHEFLVVVDSNPLVPITRCPATFSIHYTEWQTMQVDLSAYIGQNITAEFNTGDCDLGGHFGYAYIVAECDSGVAGLEIETAFTCIEENDTVVLTAPGGYFYQWSTGDTTQIITLIDPPYNSSYGCILTNQAGVHTLVQTVVTVNPSAYFGYDTTQVLSVNYTDSSLGNISAWQWDFGDGETSGTQNPTHTYDSAGTYNVSLTVTTFQGCQSSYDTTITLTVPPDTMLPPDSIMPPDISNPVAIGEIKELYFEIYPVPSKDEITVSIGAKGELLKLEICVYDVAGNLVYTTLKSKVSQGQKFNVRIAELSDGIYTLELRTKENKASHKFIKD